MTKQSAKPDIPTDMWLHVATDALGRYAQGANDVVAFMAEDADGRTGICFFLPGVGMDDPRFAPSFVAKAITIQVDDVAPMVATPAPVGIGEPHGNDY